MGQTGLHLHVSLEDRQNLNADAIQGELFIIGHASRLLSRPSRRLMAPVHDDYTRLRMW